MTIGSGLTRPTHSGFFAILLFIWLSPALTYAADLQPFNPYENAEVQLPKDEATAVFRRRPKPLPPPTPPAAPPLVPFIEPVTPPVTPPDVRRAEPVEPPVLRPLPVDPGTPAPLTEPGTPPPPVAHTAPTLPAATEAPPEVPMGRAVALDSPEVNDEIARRLKRALPQVGATLAHVNKKVTIPGGDLYQQDQLRKFPEAFKFTPEQLIIEREQWKLDRCLDTPDQKTFLNAVEGAVRNSMVPHQVETDGEIRDKFDLPLVAKEIPVSLLSHQLCVQSKEQIREIVGDSRMPDDLTIQKVAEFTRRVNIHRNAALDNILRGVDARDNADLADLINDWSQVMGCLGYEESWQTTGEPGTPTEQSNKDDFDLAMKTYPGEKVHFMKDGVATRPPGVQFAKDRDGSYYTDPTDMLKARRVALSKMYPPKSEEEIKGLLDDYLKNEVMPLMEKKYPWWPASGTFQFKPEGNVGPCVTQWNKLMLERGKGPECIIPNTPAGIMTAASTAGQTFNIWCGTQKIVQAFNSQVNTTSLRGVDSSNIIRDPMHPENDYIKPGADRCVSLVAAAGVHRMYAHFGPWRNSVKTNLKRLAKCIDFATHI